MVVDQSARLDQNQFYLLILGKLQSFFGKKKSHLNFLALHICIAYWQSISSTFRGFKIFTRSQALAFNQCTMVHENEKLATSCFRNVTGLNFYTTTTFDYLFV
jgi:hypothetical protein